MTGCGGRQRAAADPLPYSERPITAGPNRGIDSSEFPLQPNCSLVGVQSSLNEALDVGLKLIQWHRAGAKYRVMKGPDVKLIA